LILYGCELVSGNRTAGAIVINGELLPFEASPDNAKIEIVETVENAVYRDGVSRPAYKTRTAKCSSIGTINLSNLKLIGEKPQATAWQNVEYLPHFDTTGTGVMQSRVDESGKGLVVGPFESEDEYGETTDKFAVAKTSLRPKRRQPAMISNLNMGDFKRRSIPGGYATEFEGSPQYLRTVSIYGYIDTDGVLYMDNAIAGHGYSMFRQCWVSACIDLD
jgi:hypothetical protein